MVFSLGAVSRFPLQSFVLQTKGFPLQSGLESR